MQLPQETNLVLNGSYILLSCTNGYTNIGGSLNVTCSTSGSWSQFPNCVMNNSNVKPTTPVPMLTTTTMSMITTMPANGGAACLVDSTTSNITNGYYANMSLSYTASNTATGNRKHF